MQMHLQIYVYIMQVAIAIAIYSWNALQHIESTYMRITAATHLYVGRWPPHTKPPRPNRGKMQSGDD